MHYRTLPNVKLNQIGAYDNNKTNYSINKQKNKLVRTQNILRKRKMNEENEIK